MTELKREYVIPLRKKTNKVPKWRRSKKAMSVLKEFVMKHMKTDNVIIGNELNENIWKDGIKNPPGKVSVVCLKKNYSGSEKVFVNLSSIGVDSLLKNYADTNNKKLDEIKKSGENKKLNDNITKKETEVLDIESEEVETTKKDVKKDNEKEVKKDE